MSKKKLELKFSNMVNGVISRLEKVEKFTLDQLPELCKEIIEERKVKIENSIISYSLALVGATVISICLVILGSQLIMSDRNSGVAILCFISAVLSGIVCLISICCLTESVLELRVLKVTPKIFVLRSLRGML